jgi:hypothetical protein
METVDKYSFQIVDNIIHFIVYDSKEKVFVDKHASFCIKDFVVEYNGDDENPAIFFKGLNRDSGFHHIVKVPSNSVALEIVSLISHNILKQSYTIG